MRAYLFCLENYLNDLREIVNVDSGSEDLDGCNKMVLWFAKKYKAIGFDVVVKNDIGKHPMMKAIFSPKGGDEIDLLFMGHLDTVFPKGTVDKRPFTIKDNCAYGPGVADMKSGALLALYIAEELVKSNLNINICVALNSDEELGSEDSSEQICCLGANAKYCFNFEGGRPGGAFVKQRKGVYDYYINFTGIAAHAGIEPEKGANAIVEMANWIREINNLNEPEKGTTLNAGLVKGGTASNVVADDAEMVVELRYTLDLEKRRIENCFDKLREKPVVTGVKTKWKIGSGYPPMNPNETTDELIKIMQNVANNIGYRKLDFAFTGGGSDANYLGNLDVAVIDGCGPEGGFYHSEKEYMVIDSVKSRYMLIIETVKELFLG